MMRAHVLLVGSQDEGFGLPALEAFASDLPVVACSVGGLPEVCGDAAILIDALDKEAAANAVIRAVRESDLRETLISRGRRQVKLYSWEECAQQHVQLYEALMAERRSTH